MPDISGKARRSRTLNSVIDGTGASLRVGKLSHNQETGIYQTTNVFSYQSSWGTTRRHDVQTFTGTGSIIESEGAIRLSTGATNSSSVKLDTVRKGEYQPGKTAEIGIGCKIINAPTGDAWVKVGLYNETDGFFFQIEETVTNVVIRRNGVDTIIPQTEWNLDTMDGSGKNDYNDNNPSGLTFNDSAAYIWGIRFSYYGVGTINFFVDRPAGDDAPTEMESVDLHRYIPTEFPSIIDPNKSVRIEVNNGTTGSDVVVDIGGRRYDILGELVLDSRSTGEFADGVVVSATEFTPLVAMQKKATFPVGTGRENSVNSFVNEFTIFTDSDIVIYVFSGGTLDGTFTVPTELDTNETSLESNTTATTYTTGDPISGPFLLKSNAGKSSASAASSSKSLKIPVRGDQPVVLVAKSLSGGVANVSASLILIEEW